MQEWQNDIHNILALLRSELILIEEGNSRWLCIDLQTVCDEAACKLARQDRIFEI